MDLQEELKKIVEEAEHSIKHHSVEMQCMRLIELNARAEKLREKLLEEYPDLPPVPDFMCFIGN